MTERAMAAAAMLGMCRCPLSLAGSLLIYVASVSSPSRLRDSTEILGAQRCCCRADSVGDLLKLETTDWWLGI